MKYAVIKVINGSFFIHAEGITDIIQAKTIFHGVCQTLWNAPDVVTASVIIADEYLDAIAGYKEYIRHDVTPTNPDI